MAASEPGTPRAAPPAGPLAQAYDPERFRADGHALIDQLADYLRAAQAGALPVLPWREPDAELRDWPSGFEGEPQALPALIAKTLAHSIHIHHPRFVGHQVAAPLPSSALLKLAGGLLNNGTGIYEMGAAANAMEHSVLRWMAGQVGLPEGADGVLTSGGSVGNLTALLAAREAMAPGAWRDGAQGLSVLAASETHYCVKRAVQIMGLGEAGQIPVPVDARFRLRADALPGALRAAEAAGRKVFAVVASAGSTSTGAFDPIEPIADFCAAHGLWLHVDGAHGASAALTPKYAPQLRGIERADSIVWDAHKLMMVPALITAVLFRDGARSYDTFAQQAHYLFPGSARGEWWNSGLRTLECTKRMMGLELYGALALHGPRLFGASVERVFDLARWFAARLRQSGFEVPTEPDCNIVCFRLPGSDCERVRRALNESGAFYLVQTRLPSGVFLRVSLMNPLTTEADLEALIRSILDRAAAR